MELVDVSKDLKDLIVLQLFAQMNVIIMVNVLMVVFVNAMMVGHHLIVQ